MMKKFPLSALILSALYAHNSYAQTTTPIEHVIVLVGENRTFDNLYGVYQPKKKQTISNLWSKGIVKADGTPGPNYHLAAQKQRKFYCLHTDARVKTPYATCPSLMLRVPLVSVMMYRMHVFRQTCRTGHIRLPNMSATGRIPAIRYTAFSRCGNRLTAGIMTCLSGLRK
jgi:hypothetical protein